MLDFRRSNKKSTSSANTNVRNQKGQSYPVIDLVNENVKPKQLNKTPVYYHNQTYRSFADRSFSDFVYIPSSVSNSIKKSVRSDTTYNQVCKTQLKRNVSEPKSIRLQSADRKNFIRNSAPAEKSFRKRKITPIYSQPPENNHQKNVSNDFAPYREFMHGKIVKPDMSKYVITPEQKKIIESTLPPGETIIVPRILSTIQDKYGRIASLSLKSGKESVFSKPVVRKCLCKIMESNTEIDTSKMKGSNSDVEDNDGRKKILFKRKEDDSNDVIDKRKATSKRRGSKSSSVCNDIISKPKPLSKRNTILTNGENNVSDKKKLPKTNGSKSSNDKVIDLKEKKQPIKSKTKEDSKSKNNADFDPKEAEDSFKLKGRKIGKRSKKLLRRPPEKKVDDHVPYHPLISHSTRRINRSQYQKHFHLRIRGPSVLKDLRFNPVKIYHLGERGSGFRSKGDVQDFYQLRDELLESGSLFEDPEFLAVDSSIFYSQRVGRGFEWRRPHEICDNPQLFVEGYSRFDVQQGELGDCWLLAAVANLTLYRRLFFQVVPDDQSFDDKYAGIFHFRFWQYGRWIDVVIDDRLPTYNGQLVFLHSTEENEFWSALLEKAYAKLHGSYEALKGGSTCEAMEDFTGGVTEMYEMNASPPNLFKIVVKAYERSSLMGCSLEPDPNVLEAETREGLIRGHAYSITRVKYVDIQTPNASGKIPLVRLRNPWGNECEWNGPWSDKSPEWRFIPEHEKEELGLTFDDDGEFWMSFKDFQTHFDRLEICNLNPDSLTEEELQDGNKKRWEVSFFEGEWVRGVTAGGCRNYLDTFWHNPQYRITLTEVDDEDDEGKCTLIVALMQKNRRSQRNMGIDILTIGFAIYYLPHPDRAPKPLDMDFFKYNSSVARSPSFINLREVSCRFKLPPGTYCIVPSTFEPNEQGEYLLRIFSEHQNNLEENDEDIAYGEVDQRMRKLIIASLHAPIIIPTHASRDKTIKNIEPTPQETHQNDQVYEFFLKLAGDDGEVDWMELKQILDYAMRHEMRNKEFSKDVCRSMVAMLDSDQSGKLGFEEFKSLWSDIRDWKNVFRLYDKDNSGTLDGFELRQALNSAGYHLNNHILNILMHRYGNKQGQLEFDDYIMCTVKLKTMINIFKAKDPQKTNTAKFSMEEWISNTLYA